MLAVEKDINDIGIKDGAWNKGRGFSRARGGGRSHAAVGSGSEGSGGSQRGFSGAKL